MKKLNYKLCSNKNERTNDPFYNMGESESIMPSEKSLTRKCILSIYSFIQSSRTSKTNLQVENQSSNSLGKEGWEQRLTRKAHEGTLA